MGKAFAIDVSTAQGAVNWSKVRAAGIEYVWCKRSEGSEPDEERLAFFDATRAACVRHGIKWGAYHYAHVRRSNAYRNALVASGGDYGTPDLRQMLDIEPLGSGQSGWGRDSMTTGELGRWVQSWVQLWQSPCLIVQLWQSPCLIYFEHGRSHVTTLATLAYHGKRPSRAVGLFPSCRPTNIDWRKLGPQGVWDLCVSRYRWEWSSAVSAIQFSSSGEVDGIEGPVDVDVIDVERCML